MLGKEPLLSVYRFLILTSLSHNFPLLNQFPMAAVDTESGQRISNFKTQKKKNNVLV